MSVMTAKDLTEEEEMLLSGRVEQVFHKDLDSLQDLTEIVQQLTKSNPRDQIS